VRGGGEEKRHMVVGGVVGQSSVRSFLLRKEGGETEGDEVVRGGHRWGDRKVPPSNGLRRRDQE